MSLSESFEVTIPSDTAEAQSVQERIIGLLEQLEYSEHDVFGIRLALEEALVNAIKHGNGMDPEKNVHVRCSANNEKVRIEIEDEGNGFCVDKVPDPTAEENLEKPCGRGIMLMQAFMNLIEYNDRGNQVTLEKRRNSSPEDSEEPHH